MIRLVVVIDESGRDSLRTGWNREFDASRSWLISSFRNLDDSWLLSADLDLEACRLIPCLLSPPANVDLVGAAAGKVMVDGSGSSAVEKSAVGQNPTGTLDGDLIDGIGGGGSFVAVIEDDGTHGNLLGDPEQSLDEGGGERAALIVEAIR